MSDHDESNPDDKDKLSLLARTIQAIGGTAFVLGMGMPPTKFDSGMWNAAAYLSTAEYRAARRLKAAWLNGSKAG